ncbi:hypothetical protein YC2023_059894 [Brassica napus]
MIQMRTKRHFAKGKDWWKWKRWSPSLLASKIRYGRMGDVEFKRAMTKYYEPRQIAFFLYSTEANVTWKNGKFLLDDFLILFGIALLAPYSPFNRKTNQTRVLSNARVLHLESANQVAHVNCGSCRMLLMYQYGARSVKCAVCSFVTPVEIILSFKNPAARCYEFETFSGQSLSSLIKTNPGYKSLLPLNE